MNIKVLDHGYVRFIEDWGRGDADEAEAGIIEAARQSTQGSFRGWDRDEKLLRFMFSNHHSTPFEFAGLVIEVRAPIFVFREWHRHRTQSYNEMSARYAPLPNTNYLPTINRIVDGAVSAGRNKQAGAVEAAPIITSEASERWLASLEALYEHAQEIYDEGLQLGVPKELARLPVPVARYSQMRASTCLRNWLAFLTLRADPAAQWEIRQFANAVGDIIQNRFPRTWNLFQEARG